MRVPCTYDATRPWASSRTKRRNVMFSPIFCTSATRRASIVSPEASVRPESAATSPACSRTTSCAISFANARNASFFATKSVSQLSSTIAAVFASCVTAIPTTPSAATRAAALLAFAPLLIRSNSSALTRSPLASVRAFLHSIIGCPVRWRNSITLLAEISGISRSARSGRRFVDELVAGGNDFLDRVGLAFEHGIGDAARVEADGAAGVIVAGNDVSDRTRIVIRVDDGDDRDAELLRLGDGNLVIADVDDENRIRQRAHVLDPAETLLQLVLLARQRQRLALRHPVEGAVLLHRVEILEPLDGLLDGLEVRQHAAEPPVVDIRHSAALRFLGDDLARLALGADEEDRAAVARELTDVFHRVVVHRQRLFEVDDVNLVALAEDVIGHLRIPVARLVAEMDAGLQHLTHGYGHAELLRVGPPPADCARAGVSCAARHPETPVCGVDNAASSIVPDCVGSNDESSRGPAHR